jgi:phosphate transport system substrate-binding protein
MKASFLWFVCVTLSVIAIASSTACGPRAGDGSNSVRESALIKIDGSSTLFPVSEAVAEEFQKEKGGRVQVTVGISGTGGGFKKFTRGEIDMANASRPILKEEIDQAIANGIEYVELPVAFDALTVVVNRENDWLNSLTIDELKKIWEPAAQGKVTRWNQIKPEFPDQEIALFGAGSDSGTFDYFTEAIVGKAKSSRGDYTASEDDNVLVQGIEGNKYSLGYLPFAYFAPHSDRMRAIPIQWEKNKVQEPVGPSLENVLAGTYNPLSRPLFIYVNRKSLEKPEVREFVEFYLKNAAVLTKEVKYLPLPDSAYQKGLERLAANKTGSAFGGVPEIGLTIEEILARESK